MFINLKKLFLNLENITICILFSVLSFNVFAAQNESNFRNVEATGRAILIEGKIDVSRKRALEDALYIAAL